MFHTFDIFYVVLHFQEWLYNAVGFAVRCDRSHAALTCMKIIPSYLPESAVKCLRYFPSIRFENCFAQTPAETAQILL